MSQDMQNGQGDGPRKPMFDQDAGGGRQGGEQIPLDVPQRKAYTKAGGEKPSGKAPHTPEEMARRKQRNKRRRRLAALVACGLIVALLGGVVMAYYRLSDELTNEVRHEVEGSLPEEVKTEQIPEYTGKGIITGLICGIDYDNDTADGYETEDHIGNTDMIMYVMYDTQNNKCNVLQMPRDVYVGEEISTGGTGKINGVYRNSDDPSHRMAALAKCFRQQLGLPVDFYITLDLDALKALVDHRGSIDVYVPHNIVDPDNQSNVLLTEGWQPLTSQEVETFIRNRTYADADLTRLATQQSFYSALFREFKQLAPTDLVMWMRILLYYVNVEGIDLIQVGGLAQKALSLEGADITFVRPPVVGSERTQPNGRMLDLVYLVPDETADLLNEYFRPEGGTKTAEELDIQTLPTDKYGKSEASVKTMGDIQATEPPKAA